MRGSLILVILHLEVTIVVFIWKNNFNELNEIHLDKCSFGLLDDGQCLYLNVATKISTLPSTHYKRIARKIVR